MYRQLPILLSPGLFILFGVGAPAAAELNWIEDTFEDFADGQLDGSGQNIYVSRDGSIRTIHRFDLNQDGFLDLIFNSTHDTITYVPATLGTLTRSEGSIGPLEAIATPLAVEGSTQIELEDLNRDGWPDAIFCPNSSGLQHPRRYVTIIWGGEDGWPAHRSNGMLPTHDASAIAVCDLNHDAWPDIAVLNSEAWMPGQPDGRIVRIFWGGESGYYLARRHEIGISAAVQMVAGDWDDDGARDLAVLRSDGRITVFWSATSKTSASSESEGPKGDEVDSPDSKLRSFDQSVITLADREARCLEAADVNGDGQLDFVIGTGSEAIHVIEGRSAREWSPPRRVEAFPASHVVVGDLDGDSHADLVLCNFGLARAGGGEAAGATRVVESVRVMWGSGEGYAADRLTELSVPYATAAAIGDLDGDRRADLAVAVHQTPETFAADSVIFLGREGRLLERSPQTFRTRGATDVVIAPRKGARSASALFANSMDGTVGEKIPLYVYWGGDEGFDPDRRMEIPFRSGYEATSADFNTDGYVDLVALNSQHAGASAMDDPTAGANIFWGGRDGFDFDQRRTVLQEELLGTSNTADLNRDGYLDLVLGGWEFPDDRPTPIIIHYGSAEGFKPSDRVEIECHGRSIGSLIADFNRDSWLDIAVVSTVGAKVRVFWGHEEGFDTRRRSELDLPYPIDLETADLNADGYLDLIVSSYQDPVSHYHDTGTMIFWGGEEGFRAWDAQRLPGWAPVGPCVADFDSDGYLDLFTPNYLGEVTRESLPSYLFWGGPDGFVPGRRTHLICDSADDALAGDFDHDGKLDLAVVCHSVNGSHDTDSLVFLNDGRRFLEPRIQRLPTHGPHWMWGQDMGHIYHRRWEQTYVSSPFAFDESHVGVRLTYEADEPEGTTLTFFVRAAPEAGRLDKRPWRHLRDGEWTLAAEDRCLQYRALFRSANGDRYPILHRVHIQLNDH